MNMKNKNKTWTTTTTTEKKKMRKLEKKGKRTEKTIHKPHTSQAHAAHPEPRHTPANEEHIQVPVPVPRLSSPGILGNSPA